MIVAASEIFMNRELHLSTIAAALRRDEECPLIWLGGEPGFGRDRLVDQVIMMERANRPIAMINASSGSTNCIAMLQNAASALSSTTFQFTRFDSLLRTVGSASPTATFSASTFTDSRVSIDFGENPAEVASLLSSFAADLLDLSAPPAPRPLVVVRVKTARLSRDLVYAHRWLLERFLPVIAQVKGALPIAVTYVPLSDFPALRPFARRLTVGGLTPDHVRDWFARLGMQATDDVVSFAHASTRGAPGSLAVLLQNAAGTGEESDLWGALQTAIEE
jgi:hypothetical protein